MDIQDRESVMNYARAFGRDIGTQLIFQDHPTSFCIIGKTGYAVGVILQNGRGTRVFPEHWEYDSFQTPEEFIRKYHSRFQVMASPYKDLDKEIDLVSRFGHA